MKCTPARLCRTAGLESDTAWKPFEAARYQIISIAARFYQKM
jgi:hypothetical protein